MKQGGAQRSRVQRKEGEIGAPTLLSLSPERSREEVSAGSNRKRVRAICADKRRLRSAH
jgi:hypothetical protein